MNHAHTDLATTLADHFADVTVASHAEAERVVAVVLRADRHRRRLRLGWHEFDPDPFLKDVLPTPLRDAESERLLGRFLAWRCAGPPRAAA